MRAGLGPDMGPMGTGTVPLALALTLSLQVTSSVGCGAHVPAGRRR